MASENTVTLVGNITDDPELRFTPSGAAVANFTVAVNRRTRNQDGTWEDKTDGFFRCNCWREMAENVAESLEKGARIVLVGRLQQRSWETEEGRRSVVEVLVDEVGPSLRWATAKPQKSTKTSARPAPAPEPARPAPAPEPASPAAAESSGGESSGGDWTSPAPVGGPPTEEGGF